MKNFNLKMEINLRTRGFGIGFDGKDLCLTAIQNKLNQVHYKGYEVLEDYESKSDEEVLDFIEDFQGKYKVKRADAYLAIPRNQAVVQVVEFPPEAFDNLEEVMEYQLGNYFAGDLDDTEFFPQIISKTDQLKVMIVAVKKETLGQAYGFIRRWKLKLSGVTLDSFLVVNGLARTDTKLFAQSKIAVFHSFASGLEMIVLKSGRLVTSYYLPIEDPDDREVVVDHLEQGFGQARIDPNDIDHYLWAGRDHWGLKNYLAEDLGFPFEIWRDLKGTSIDEGGLTGFGAAVCAVVDKPHLGLNMLPDKLRKRQKRLPLILATIAFSIFALYFLVNEVSDYRGLLEEHTQVTREHNQIMEQMREISNARSQLQVRQEELEHYQRYQTSNLMVKVLATLARDLPDNTYLTHVQVKKGINITIQGESEDPFHIQRILTDIPFLQDVKPGNAITSGRNTGKRRFMYKAVLNLEALR